MNTQTAHGQPSAGKQFAKYVSQNILGMLGISAYILADTFFIAKAEGTSGITALNLVLPLYNLIFAIGSMMGVGSATRFRIYRAQKEKKADDYFSNAVFFAFIFGSIFILAGIFAPAKLLELLGGDAEIVKVGTTYTRIFLLFAPLFMLNYIFNAFVRNDGNPSLAMTATLSSSLFNIVFDYVLMFPLKMGMPGAALATAFSPVVGIGICCTPLFSQKSTVRFVWKCPSVKRLVQSCQLGVAAFVGEMSSGVITMVFNMLILEIAGNVGVAAYGVVANMALVATAIFNGISQGSQPLFSEFFGKGDRPSVSKVLRLAVLVSLGMAGLLLLLVNGIPGPIVAAFNSENDAQMTAYAVTGLRLYFIGFIFAGINIVGSGYLSAVAEAGWAFFTSILRGFVAIILCAVVMAKLFGMEGVWLAFPVSEFITAAVMSAALILTGKKQKNA